MVAQLAARLQGQERIALVSPSPPPCQGLMQMAAKLADQPFSGYERFGVSMSIVLRFRTGPEFCRAKLSEQRALAIE